MVKNNDILIYSTHNEGNSVTAEKFIKPSRNKMYKNANNSKYLPYLNKLLDQNNYT